MQYCSGEEKKHYSRNCWQDTLNCTQAQLWLLLIVLPFFSLISENFPQDEKSDLKICDVIKSRPSRNSQGADWRNSTAYKLGGAAHSRPGRRLCAGWAVLIGLSGRHLCVQYSVIQYIYSPLHPSPVSSFAQLFKRFRVFLSNLLFSSFFFVLPYALLPSLPSIVPSHPLLSPELSFNHFLLLISFHPLLSPSSFILCYLTPFSLLLLSFKTSLIFSV